MLELFLVKRRRSGLFIRLDYCPRVRYSGIIRPIVISIIVIGS